MAERLAVLALLTVLAGGGVFVALRDRPPAEAPLVMPSLTTVAVVRTDLVDKRLYAGTIGFGTARVLKGTGEGVITKLPQIGTEVARGTELYRVDDKPVVVFYGDTPFFRPIDKPGIQGSDVFQLRRNLDALGYETWAADESLSDKPLMNALKRWQQKRGLAEPGTLKPGQVIVVGGPGRVSNLAAEPGAPASGPVVEVTSTTKVVTLPMSAAEAGSVSLKEAVTIALPDGREVKGTVTDISRTVLQAPDSTEPPKITVTVTPDEPPPFDAAPVQVRFTMAAREQVLAVPVGALVALREGGYALQTPDGTLIAVTTGVFAGGLVEVSGAGVDTGTTVVTTP
ncbi:efflux RND transporter periplasmic adaptor subunit [Catenuloplanes japonicus]|uniref:peptidoglycan-binding protein n=1 Tax=Catenuloplanes japonicus TaxID=33876 RepID=UPI00068EAFCF|nr:peptidoglycan-binding protein [Catenuloplanes japonicus]